MRNKKEFIVACIEIAQIIQFMYFISTTSIDGGVRVLYNLVFQKYILFEYVNKVLDTFYLLP